MTIKKLKSIDIINVLSDLVSEKLETTVKLPAKPYEYTAFFNYNKECIKGKGSAYFFHCFGTHDYTMGCVALHHDIVKYLFTMIDEKTIMIIDSYDNLYKY